MGSAILGGGDGRSSTRPSSRPNGPHPVGFVDPTHGAPGAMPDPDDEVVSERLKALGYI
jgi:hypothetical protein